MKSISRHFKRKISPQRMPVYRANFIAGPAWQKSDVGAGGGWPKGYNANRRTLFGGFC
jgi:hypothetical protein